MNNMKTLQEQSEIVKQRLEYHFRATDGTWNIEGMNAPFMKEFLNEVERLCALSNVVGRSERLIDFALKEGYFEGVPKGNLMGLIDRFENQLIAANSNKGTTP
jgi:hypothetical protein